MKSSPLMSTLCQALQCLPGVGPKSAQRMVFYLLERDRDGGKNLAKALGAAMDKVKQCPLCRNLTELSLCTICADRTRNQTQICVVETPANVEAIEQTQIYCGLYFVLMGHLSPIDGVGPEEIGFPLFEQRLNDEEAIEEVILATNPTIEGEATAYYLAECIKKHNIKATRIAHGVPLGGDLEYVDGGTLSRALCDRGAV